MPDPSTRATIPFEVFRKAVRRHRPSELLPTLAAMSVRIGEPPYDVQALRTASPWFTALAARESILWGNEHRKDRNEQKHLVQLVNLFNDIDSHIDPDIGVSASLIRTVHEQFPFQESVREDISRAHAMLVEPLDDGLPLEVVTPDAWTRLLGAPLGQTLGATFLHYFSALQLEGRLDLSFLDRPDMKPFLDMWSREAIDATSERLTMTVEQFKDDYRLAHQAPYRYQRHGYNPLVKAPFVLLPDGQHLAPQYNLILKTLTPGALFYPGVKMFGDAFARDLGVLAEHYVGRQLKTISGVEVHGEVTYGGSKTIDWFVVFPELTLLVEVKSRRMNTGDTADTPDLARKIAEVVGRANRQLARTHDLMESGHAAVNHIPKDRPVVGLVVTTEPLYFANSHWVRDHLDPLPFPTLTASMRDLENMVRLDASTLAESLLAIAQDPELSTWYLTHSLSEHTDEAWGPESPILTNAWNAYPWPDDPAAEDCDA